jgi:DNA-binding response OmpR family regulator
MSAPRVLLVEDDASIRRFVLLALDDLPVTLIPAGTLAEAEAVLADAPVALLISDLMLPDGNGAALLQALAADPARRGGARLVAFSAGLSAEHRRLLLAAGVDEVLDKPVSLQALEGCVRRALTSAAAPHAAVPLAPASVIERFFAGDAALYRAYRTSCRLQFVADLRQGELARAGGDLPGLRRLAHSLKTVLLTLGHDDGARQAASVEGWAATDSPAVAWAGWAGLACTLAAWLEAPDELLR